MTHNDLDELGVELEMQAVVLAAGTGTRLMPLTSMMPKALIPVANRPLLDYVIDSLEQANIKEIIVVTGHLENKVVRYLESSRRYGRLNIELIRARNYSAGPLYSLLASEKLVSDDFLLAAGDIIAKPQIISKLVNSHTKKETVDISICEPKPHTPQRTCVVLSGRSESNKEKVLQFLEPTLVGRDNKRSSLTILGTSTGIVICPKGIFKYGRIAAKEGYSRVVDALNRYIAEGGAAGYVNVGDNDYWFDVDTIEIMLEANSFLLKNSIVDKEVGHFYPSDFGSMFAGGPRRDYGGSDVTVLGPVIIGKDCVIGKESKIGPYVSIHNNCVIGRRVTCRNAIVLGRSRVRDNTKIENAVISDHQTILARMFT